MSMPLIEIQRRHIEYLKRACAGMALVALAGWLAFAACWIGFTL